MNNLEKKLSKLEKIISSKCNHSGVFLIFSKDDAFILQNYEDKDRKFDSIDELEYYIYSKYQCEKYVFLYFKI